MFKHYAEKMNCLHYFLEIDTYSHCNYYSYAVKIMTPFVQDIPGEDLQRDGSMKI